MASKCMTCNESILNSDFIKCEGACSQLFHSKCVALNKTTLNVIASNSNVHWYCHECNSGNRNVTSTIDNFRESIVQLTQSLSADLSNFTNGFKGLSETLIGNIAVLSNVNQTQQISDVPISNKKTHQEDFNDDCMHRMSRKKIILGSNEKDRSMAAVDIKNNNTNLSDPIVTAERRRSVVVSNIGSSITADYLTNYLATELNINKERIRVTPLANNRREFNSLQYRISTPECNYDAVMTPNTWPKNVRIRDYIFKPRCNGVSIDNFFKEGRR